MMLKQLFRRREERALTLRDPDGWRVLFGATTAAGVTVTPESALGHPAILGAVRLLAELVASLPLVVYERSRRGRQRAEGHPVYRLLHDVPNDLQTPYVFKETLVLHLLLYGNAYALIVREGEVPVALWPLHPTRVSVEERGGGVVYRVQGSQGARTYRPEDVVHVPVLAQDGLRGTSPVQLAREAIGAALAAEEFAARYFANNAAPSGVISLKTPITEEAARRLKQLWQQLHGDRYRHGVAVLDNGAEFLPVSSTAQQAQLVEARQFALRLLAVAMRIPPHLLDPSARGTYANVETQSLEFLTFALQPLLTRFEEAFTRRLLDGARYYAEFLTDGLLRADTLSRYRAYEIGLRAGFLTVDEVRRRENLPGLTEEGNDAGSVGVP
ncbi:MAG: phage portal protein [Thermorudis peleae]|nr:phage portal protein [Thermorudis peleae]